MADTNLPSSSQGSVDKEKHVATYIDDQGVQHRLSSYCTHEHCDVDWDSNADNWYCLCHGARFKGTGEVINGPATEPLRKLRDDE